MANKRALKKEINYIFDELFAEVLFNIAFQESADREKATQLLNRINVSQENLIQRISHPDGKENRKITKQYFRKLNDDLGKEIEEITAGIGAIARK